MSSVMKIPVPTNASSFGELSLSGEIKSVRNMDTRVAESIRMGFDKLCVPVSYKFLENKKQQRNNMQEEKPDFRPITEEMIDELEDDSWIDQDELETDINKVRDKNRTAEKLGQKTEMEKAKYEIIKFHNISQVHAWLKSME